MMITAENRGYKQKVKVCLCTPPRGCVVFSFGTCTSSQFAMHLSVICFGVLFWFGFFVVLQLEFRACYAGALPLNYIPALLVFIIYMMLHPDLLSWEWTLGFFFFFYPHGARAGAQGLINAKQVLYH
jgi:hypothetical protein